jgi:hypothetical protein
MATRLTFLASSRDDRITGEDDHEVVRLWNENPYHHHLSPDDFVEMQAKMFELPGINRDSTDTEFLNALARHPVISVQRGTCWNSRTLHSTARTAHRHLPNRHTDRRHLRHPHRFSIRRP